MLIEPPEDLDEVVALALREDVGAGDLSADLIPPDQWAEGQVITREATIVCGTPWFDSVFRQLNRHVIVGWYVAEGEAVMEDTVLCRLAGPARALLTGERTALNFLQTLCGTASSTHRHAEAVRGSGCRILDTRKTIPGLRSAQKYAVRVGGGSNHRLGLHDAVMVKENHIAAAGSITRAVAQTRLLHPGTPLIVEVETLDQLAEALELQVPHVLLDNFELPLLERAVAMNGGRAKLEASGGIASENLQRVAATGVDFISLGAITKHVRAIDLSLRLQPQAEIAAGNLLD
jgi:nicotinate-nucleotide pyrophosphorylase (carboxylating)